MASREDGTIVLGPWGGSGGTEWSFVNAHAITKIKISLGDVIDSITFQYMDGQTARWSPRFGGAGGKPTEVKLGPAEFIISMKGYYGDYAGMTIIYSLTFVTTVREYGPYGREQGTQFSVPKGTGWISGFLGRSGTLLDAIGVYKKTTFEPAFEVGPWGGSGGDTWSFENALAITKIKISVGDVIRSITFQYMDGATARWSPRYGGAGGRPTEIVLGPAEFITSLKGYYGAYSGMTIINSLTFVTNLREYGPYGPERGTQFCVPKGTGWINGFYGRSGDLLDAIGVYRRISIEPAVVVGPWGGSGGTAWVFEHALAITKIKINAGYVIDSITFQYIDGATARWSPTYGGTGGQPTEIDLGTNNPLKAISGYYGNYRGIVVIKSLTFVSAKGIYGPFGREEGTAFSIPIKVGNVAAFFGRAGQWLDALGFYLKPHSV